MMKKSLREILGLDKIVEEEDLGKKYDLGTPRPREKLTKEEKELISRHLLDYECVISSKPKIELHLFFNNIEVETAEKVELEEVGDNEVRLKADWRSGVFTLILIRLKKAPENRLGLLKNCASSIKEVAAIVSVYEKNRKKSYNFDMRLYMPGNNLMLFYDDND